MPKQLLKVGWWFVMFCNMFFVIILLVIAFATVLGQEEYGAKKMLPKLVMAAVLINFSKMFCGLMIDFASVIMLTFVNAFSAIGAGNILDVLGITEVTKIDPSVGGAITFGTIVSAYIFGLIYVVIATAVVAAMLGMLVMRVVMIWILVVLSPLAFFLQAVPGKGQSYANQWWTRWTDNLIVGPVLAFFLWLSFAALQAGGNASPIATNGDADTYLAGNNSTIDVPTDGGGIGTKAGSVAGMAKFVIAIGMLLGGMKIAQEVGGETGAVFGKGMAKLQKGGMTALNTGKSVGKWAGKGAGRLAGRGALGVVSQSGLAINKLRGKEGRGVVGNFAKGWGDDLQAAAKKRKKATAGKYLTKLGIGEQGSKAGKELIDSKGFQNSINAVKGTIAGAGLGLVSGGLPGLFGGAVAGAYTGWSASAGKKKERRNKTICRLRGGISQC